MIFYRKNEIWLNNILWRNLTEFAQPMNLLSYIFYPVHNELDAVVQNIDLEVPRLNGIPRKDG